MGCTNTVALFVGGPTLLLWILSTFDALNIITISVAILVGWLPLVLYFKFEMNDFDGSEHPSRKRRIRQSMHQLN